MNSSSSGTVSRPAGAVVVPAAGAPVAAVPPPTGSPLPEEVEVWVSAGATPDCSAAALR